MKKTLFICLLVILSVSQFCLAQTGQVDVSSKLAGTQHSSPNNMYGQEFPRIEADNSVTFKFNAPDAQKVQVAIANEAKDMVKDADGVWTYRSEPQDFGYHNYWMIVDGAVVLDPATDGFIGYSRNPFHFARIHSTGQCPDCGSGTFHSNNSRRITGL